MLKMSSIPNEYYLGDLPGRIQYSKDPEEIIGCVCFHNNIQTHGYELCAHSFENLQRVKTVADSKKMIHDWKILLMMKSEKENGVTWLKVALQDKTTGKIALLTSTNRKDTLTNAGHRAARTLDGEWFVGRYRMSAPIVFWEELVNRIKYSL